MSREEMIEYVLMNYLKLPIKTMAKNLGKSQQFVRDIMKKYQINVPSEIKEYFIQNSRFKKGNESFNKGKKLQDYLTESKIEKVKKTSFQKGNKPHNTKPEGYQSIRAYKRGIPYIFIKVGEKMKPLHRHIYEENFGFIPNGYNVQFKDGDTLNTEIDNLYLISKKEQAFINHQGGYKIPNELYETLIIIKKIKNTINEKQDNRPQ